MSMHPEMDVLRYLQREAVNIVKRSEQGSHACGPMRVSAIIVAPEAGRGEAGAAWFRAYLELQDDDNRRCEAELLCRCTRLPGDGAAWRITVAEVLEVLKC